jgi:hypothetical protein
MWLKMTYRLRWHWCKASKGVQARNEASEDELVKFFISLFITIIMIGLLHSSVVIFSGPSGSLMPALISVENWVPLKLVLWGVRDVALIHYPSCSDSIKPSVQLLCYFVVINASEGSLCFRNFIWYDKTKRPEKLQLPFHKIWFQITLKCKCDFSN